jgi:threonine/homoserine/homoserine lactone efflux protein
MSIEAWLLFVATETVLCLSPGPAVLFVLSVSLTRGWPPGLHASAGILVANLLYFFLSATSLGAILLASWELFFLIKWLGAGYLIWLGLKTFLARGDAALPLAERPTLLRPGMGTFLRGVVAQGANPKTLLYFTALLPQFVNTAEPLAPQIMLLAGTSVLIECGILAGYAVLASRASHLAHRPRFARIIHRVGGGLLIGAGAGQSTYKRLAADCLQRPLRSRYSPRLTPGVDMTSNVKSCEPIFFRSSWYFLSSVHRKSRSQHYATGDPAARRGLVTTFRASVGCLPLSRLECPVPAS